LLTRNDFFSRKKKLTMHHQQETLIYRWYQQVWNEGNEKAIDEMMNNDVVAHGISDGLPLKGKDEFRNFYSNFRNEFSDINVIVEDVMVEDDFECGRCYVNAVHRSSNKPVQFTGIAMVKLRDGKIAEGWNNFDFLKMNLQLGMKLVQE